MAKSCNAKQTEIRFLPIVKKVAGFPARLLRIAVPSCGENAPECLTASVSVAGCAQTVELPLYAEETDRWIYRAFVSLPDAESDARAEISVRLPDGSVRGAELSTDVPQWREICFVPITHHDLGYTQTLDVVLQDYCRFYDLILDFCDATADYPEEAQFRYTVEQFWSLDYYLSRTSRTNIERVKRYVRNGRIEITATYANILDSNLNSEEIIRLLLPAMRFAEECGVTVKSAAQVDMPGLSSATVRALCDAGIPYFFAGFPQYFGWSAMGLLGDDGLLADMKRSHWDERGICPWGHPFACHWHADASDSRSLFTWYQFGYGWFCSDSKFSDTTDSLDEIERKLPEFLLELSERGYPYPLMRYIVRGTDNQCPDSAISDIVRAWNETYLSPKLSVTTNAMFFEKLEQAAEPHAPIRICGEMPHTDYTMLSLCEAEHNTLNARSRIRLANTEKMLGSAVLHGLVPQNPQIPGRISDAWRDIMLFDEHAFGMGAVHGALFHHNRGLKMQYALSGAMKSDSLRNDSLECIRSALSAERDAVTVFNPAGHEVPGVLHLFGDSLPENAILRDDETGALCPVQTMTASEFLLPYPGYDDHFYLSRVSRNLKEHMAFVGTLAPCSFKTFRILQADVSPEPKPRPRCPESEIVLESRFYVLRADRNTGCVLSLWDVQNDRELLSADDGFARIIIHDPSEGVDETARVLSAERRMSGPVAESLLIRSAGTRLPSAVTEIVLYQSVPRVDVNVRLTLAPLPLNTVWMAFPFAAAKPDFFFATPNGSVRLGDRRNLVPGSNTHQITFSGYCGVQDSDYCTVMASPEGNIVSFGDIYPCAVSPAHHFLPEPGYEKMYTDPSNASNGHLYVSLAHNNARTNFSAYQSGQAIYRFSFTSGIGTDASSFAAQALDEPELFRGSALPTGSPSGFRMEGDCLKLQHIGLTGDGAMLRVQNPSADPGQGVLHLPRPLRFRPTDLAGASVGPSAVASQIPLTMGPFTTRYYLISQPDAVPDAAI